MNFMKSNSIFPMARSLARPAHQAAKLNPNGMGQLESAKNDFIEQQQDLINDIALGNQNQIDSTVVLTTVNHLVTNK